MTKVFTILAHYPAALGGAMIGYAMGCGQPVLTGQAQSVIMAGGAALLLAGGLKLAGLLPDDEAKP